MAGYGNRTGIISSFTDLGVPDEPDMRGKRVVFDPQVDARTNFLLKDWGQQRRNDRAFLADWTKDFNAATPEYEANAGQEKAELAKFFDGTYQGYLSGLRTAEAGARRSAGDRALQFARGNVDRANILGGSPNGNNSASRALSYNLGRDIENDIALNGVARERQDFNWLVGNQSANIGRRNAITDGLLARKLLPTQLSDQQLMFAINSLGSITNIRNAISQPVFWREKGTMEKVGDVLDTFADSAYKGANAFSTFSGMGGGMGGGGGGITPSGGGTSTGSSGGYSGMTSGQTDSMMNGPQQQPIPQGYQGDSGLPYNPDPYGGSPNDSPGQRWYNYGGTFG